MARLPIPGADQGNWGNILNDYLQQALSPEGTLKENVVTSSAIAPNAVTASAIAPNSVTTTSLASNAVNATIIADGSITEALLDASVQAKLNASSGIVLSTDISDSTATGRSLLVATDAATARSVIGAGTSNLTIGTTSTTAKAGDYVPTKSEIGLGNADNTSDADKPISTATQTALNLKAPLASPIFSGTVTVPTPTNATDATTKAYVDSAAASGTPDATSLVKGKIQLTGDLGGTADSPTVPGLAGKEPTITAGTTAQYYRGDKTWQTLDKSAVGLASVDNTSDAVKNSAIATLSNKTLTNPTITDYVETKYDIGTVTTSYTINLANGTFQTCTLTASTACTFTMPTATAGKSFILLVNQAAVTGGGTASFTGVKWAGGVAPTITAAVGKMDALSFFTDGTNWYGSFIQNY